MDEYGVEACRRDCGGELKIEGPFTQNCVNTAPLISPNGDPRPPRINTALLAILMRGSWSKNRANFNGCRPHFSAKFHSPSAAHKTRPGVLNMTGTRSSSASWAALHGILFAMNTKLNLPREKWIISGPLETHTEMSTCYLTRPVNLPAFHVWATQAVDHPLIDSVQYNRSFVGLRIRIRLPQNKKVSFTIYSTGSIVITGARTATIARQAIDLLFPLVSQFAVPFASEEERDAFEDTVAVVKFEDGKHPAKDISRTRASDMPGDVWGLNDRARWDKRARNFDMKTGKFITYAPDPKS